MAENLPSIEQSVSDALRRGPNYSGTEPAPQAFEAASVVHIPLERGRAILRLHNLYERSQSEPATALRVQQELNKLCGLYATPDGDMLPADFVRERWELGIAAQRKAIEDGINAAIPILLSRRLKTERGIRKCLTMLILNAFDSAGLNPDQQTETDADPV